MCAAQAVILPERPTRSRVDSGPAELPFVPSSGTSQLEPIGLVPVHRVYPTSNAVKPPSITLKAKEDVKKVAEAQKSAEGARLAKAAEDEKKAKSVADFNASLRAKILAGEDTSFWRPVERIDTLRAALAQPLQLSGPQQRNQTFKLAAETTTQRAAAQAEMSALVDELYQEAGRTLEQTDQLSQEQERQRKQRQERQRATSGSPSGSPSPERHPGRVSDAHLPAPAPADAGSPAKEAAAAAQPGTSGSASGAAASKSKKAARKPAWALTPDEAVGLEAAEEADLLSFAEGLDFDGFVSALDDAELQGALTELQAADKAPDEAAWRRTFVRAMNHAALRRVQDSVRAARGEGRDGDDDDMRSDAGGSQCDAKSRASAIKERLESASVGRPASGEGAWDASTRADDSVARMERASKAREAYEVLRENPELRAVHSPASVLAVLAKAEKQQQQQHQHQRGANSVAVA